MAGIASLFGVLGLASTAAAHGFVQGIVIGDEFYSGFIADKFPYESDPPAVIGWSTTATDKGFVDGTEYTDPNIICHKNATPGAISASVAAGGKVELQWTPWPDSHHGPVIDYLANCNGNCSTVDKTTLEFFKIDQAGLINDTVVPGTWASDELIANNNSWTVTIPTSIAPGNYVLRHEIIALHSAGNEDGAQNYPQCINLEITGSGTDKPSGTPGEKLYSPTDPGILVNIYASLSTYDIPGPALYDATSAGVAATSTGVAQAGVTTSPAAVTVTSPTGGSGPTTLVTKTVPAPTPGSTETPQPGNGGGLPPCQLQFFERFKMFKKKPTIKTLSSIRSSDRRKIADQIIKDYNIAIPTAAPLSADESKEKQNNDDTPAKETASNLTTIRNAILPENSLSARFTTTAGPDLREVQGTVYVGSHPEFAGEERILWFKLEQGPGADGRIYPTVYSLWHNPRLIPLLYTPAFVMGKLFGGADLMTPGLANDPPFPSAAVKGATVAVSSLDSPTVPLFVGVCEIDVAGLGDVQGSKGHAVRGLHWEGDELWSWSSSSRPGQPAPEFLEGWDEETRDVEEAVEKLQLGETEGEGGVSLGKEAEEEPEEPEKEPTVKEIETAFVKAFIYSLYRLKKDNPDAPNHGLALPIQPSALISSHITPHLPVYSSQQAQFYQIKRTSWKNVKKFIKHLDKEQLVKSKDRNGQETVILDVDFNDYRVAQFVPYRLPTRNVVESSGKAVSGKQQQKLAEDGVDPSVGQTLTVQVLYRPSPKLAPTLFPARQPSDPKNYYKYSEVSSHLDQYLSSQDLISAANRRIIKLDPFLANTIYTSSSGNDQAARARGEVTRDGLLQRIVSDASLVAPYHAILKGRQTLEDVKPKSGPAPKATLSIERRGSAKTVSKISGFEVFGIIPGFLAEELSKKCASSASVAQATGAVKGLLEILVQGDQRKAIQTALERRGVKSQWVDVVDKLKKKKT
ncbi:Endoglucanase-4 [Talaromyces islandicus]|uniref:AA9 family lytic polysaccharide monooxygenase n=1 Tax=Talaromyces islandicus TaxID=28573 RepID=A0A0U1M2X9_TALIS|nr:Endoglucanase-4 [Talaromyces islandicus]